MQNLTEKYRPQTLSDVRGQPLIVRQLQSFKRNPASKAFLFSGPAGVGKTSAAVALAFELCGGDDAWHGVTPIPAGDLNAESVRDLRLNTLATVPWHGTGWKAIVCNEVDNFSQTAEFLLLDLIENLPPKTIFIFTTNNPEKLSSRFRQRCECHVFKAAVKDFGNGNGDAELAAQAMIDDVWVKELGHNHAPNLADLDGWREGGNLSFRSVLQALEPLIRLQREDDEAAAIKSAELAAMPVAPVAGGRVSALAEMNAARAMFANLATA